MSFRDEGDGSVDDPIFVGPQKWPVREYIHTIRLKGFRICQTSLNIRNIYIYQQAFGSSGFVSVRAK